MITASIWKCPYTWAVKSLWWKHFTTSTMWLAILPVCAYYCVYTTVDTNSNVLKVWKEKPKNLLYIVFFFRSFCFVLTNDLGCIETNNTHTQKKEKSRKMVPCVSLFIIVECGKRKVRRRMIGVETMSGDPYTGCCIQNATVVVSCCCCFRCWAFYNIAGIKSLQLVESKVPIQIDTAYKKMPYFRH